MPVRMQKISQNSAAMIKTVLTKTSLFQVHIASSFIKYNPTEKDLKGTVGEGVEE